jgi:hypothetical protein
LNPKRYTLLADGTSDQMLIPIINWLLRQLAPETSFVSQWADLGKFMKPPKRLDERIKASIFFYESDLLFIHRDSEKETLEARLREIQNAITAAGTSCPAICIVPVRMSESWLLVDEAAIRKAADRPNGNVNLNLPSIDRIEHLPDPKATILEALRTASEARGRRLAKFGEASRRHRIAELMSDPSVLRRLSAFQQLEGELKERCTELGWA